MGGYPEGPCAQQLGTWVLGNSTCSSGFGQLCDYGVFGTVGLPLEAYRSPGMQLDQRLLTVQRALAGSKAE